MASRSLLKVKRTDQPRESKISKEKIISKANKRKKNRQIGKSKKKKIYKT